MSVIAFNALLRITAEDCRGLYRVIADPVDSQLIYLAKLHEAQKARKGEKAKKAPDPTRTRFLRSDLEKLEEDGLLTAVGLQTHPKHLKALEQLNVADRRKSERRWRFMSGFCDHEKLCYHLTSRSLFAQLVRTAREKSNPACSRSTIYRLWALLCLYGLDLGSLNTNFDRCGAPNVSRPCGASTQKGGLRKKAGRMTAKQKLNILEEHPQGGMTNDWRKIVLPIYQRIPNPKPDFPDLYSRIMVDGFVHRFEVTSAGVSPIMPERGSFPNRRQIRHFLDKTVKKIDRILALTTQGHFTRNNRGLSGFAWQGVAGPGHRYAIDSTVGKVFLRSSVNRAWILGRPIVYIVVDVWSTAVVGFYVCMTGPSWNTAKLALFSTCAPPSLMGSLWGYEPVMALTPDPALPYDFLCDRGEYLSALAASTGDKMGINYAYAGSYRPDLKGLVEVLNRITKDGQFRFAPGAIDARRKELELSTDIRESSYTLREYVQYLHWVFALYNLQADRSHRLTTEMIGAYGPGVRATPAGLWAYGHQTKLGYRKAEDFSRIVTNLLPPEKVVVNRKGIHFGNLLYESAKADKERWTETARNLGCDYLTAYRFPGSTSRLWWPDPVEPKLHEFNLSANARASPDVSFDEWLDAVEVSKLQIAEREYERLSGQAQQLVRIKELNQRAQQLTDDAEALWSGSKPSIRETRQIEDYVQPTPKDIEAKRENVDSSQAMDEYEKLMEELLHRSVDEA